MTNVPFTHLHTHSPEGSLLDGFMRIDKAIAKVKEHGMDALGISDHGTMAAHEKFYNACREADIHPVLGMEAYITSKKEHKKIDFDAIQFVENEAGENHYRFMTEEEYAVSTLSWQKVDEIAPNKLKKEVLDKAKSLFLLQEVEKTLEEGIEMPTTKTMQSRMTNAYIKTLKKSESKDLYVEADTTQRDYFKWFPRIGHLLLVAMNNEGYQNLLKLNAIGHLEGFYGKPRIDFEDMAKYGKGIAATTACLGSMTSQLIMKGYLKEAKEEIQRLVDCFDEVYLEIQPSKQPEQHLVNKQLIEWSEELGLPLIATSDAHMVNHDELHIHEALTHIGKGGSNDNSDQDSDISVYDSAFLMTPEEILSHDIPPIALQNAYDLSHRCQVTFLDDKEPKFPEYDIPEEHTFDSYLLKLSHEGLFDVFMQKDYITDYKVYQDRLMYELGIIADKGLSAYFVIVWDYINAAREKGIFVGPGRGLNKPGSR